MNSKLLTVSTIKGRIIKIILFPKPEEKKINDKIFALNLP